MEKWLKSAYKWVKRHKKRIPRVQMTFNTSDMTIKSLDSDVYIRIFDNLVDNSGINRSKTTYLLPKGNTMTVKVTEA